MPCPSCGRPLQFTGTMKGINHYFCRSCGTLTLKQTRNARVLARRKKTKKEKFDATEKTPRRREGRKGREYE
jgi:hypothetical protein